MICTKAMPIGSPIGKACTECEHALILHPGLANPSVKACVICTVLDGTVPWHKHTEVTIGIEPYGTPIIEKRIEYT